MSHIVLDHRLAAETVAVADLALCRVLLRDDRHFPWLIVVPRRPGVSELLDLTEEERGQLMIEIAWASDAMREAFVPDKMNIAMLGNEVPQLHVHVIARFKTDIAWPRPVWGVVERVPYDPEVLAEKTAVLSLMLAI